jgi:hypothetical protein
MPISRAARIGTVPSASKTTTVPSADTTINNRDSNLSCRSSWDVNGCTSATQQGLMKIERKVFANSSEAANTFCYNLTIYSSAHTETIIGYDGTSHSAVSCFLSFIGSNKLFPKKKSFIMK